MLDTYLTIHKISKGLYKEKGSKFLSFAFPVNSLEEVKSVMEDIKKCYHDARHHCYAYRLGKDGEVFRANDDGEPNHSAGDPILGQIKAFGITQVLIVVVRYFGGTKLGVGGLINAYRTAARAALEKAKIVEVVDCQVLTISYGYEQTTQVMGLIGKYDLPILKQYFSEDCTIQINCPKSKVAIVVEALKDIGLTCA
jgi:uncharacterized YigZ family protein